MRSLTLVFLGVPSFMATAQAQDGPTLNEKYRMLGVQISCARECDQQLLQNQSLGKAETAVRRQFSSCRMKCSDDYNKTSSIAPTVK
jgi:hypothetical protein